MSDPYNENSWAPEDRAAMIRLLCTISQLTEAHAQHYIDSTMTLNEIRRELTHLRGYRDLRRGETVGRRRPQ